MYEPRWFAGLLREVGSAVASRVVWAGEQGADVVAAAYAAAEVFVFPSRTDTQALVLQEAALAGLPAVLADPMLHRYGVLDGAGLCAEPDPASFAAAVGQLLSDPAAARRLGALAAAKASRHTPARYAAAMLGVYHHAGRHHARGGGDLRSALHETAAIPVV
jgi:glycosyltransferase involved in cell wall biosynthesis